MNLNEFQLFNSAHVPCGTLDFFAYQENENVIWMAAYLDRHQFLNPYHIARLTVLAEENWFDVNRDGIFDEKYTDPKAVDQVYGKICDAVK